jgi:RHS repeat-associated protein
LVRTELTSDPEGSDFLDIAYDPMGRKQSQSNPYRDQSDPTYGVTMYQYDALGRTTQVAPQDGTPPATSCDANNVCTSYSGSSTTVTDQVGNSRTSKTDGLGRLIEVDEPNPAGGTATTLYRYDALDNLLCAVQTGVASPTFSSCAASPASWRPRSFTYDSLSRLTSATNPETNWNAISYTYDANGNVLTKTAPEPNAASGSPTVTTTYTYDALDRLTGKSYTGMTAAAVQYGYDGVAPPGCSPPALPDPYPKPLRTSMCDGSGATSWSHWPMGWVAEESRTIGNVNETTGYNYNLDGSVASIAYPSGHTVNYTYSGARRALSAVDSAGAANYITAARYTPPGQLAAASQGANILTANSYNNRLQPVTLAAAVPGAQQSVFSLNYNFHWGAGDNGNVYQIVNNRNSALSQHFSYDSLNRIVQGWSTANSGWGESYVTDIWGNMTNINAISCKTSHETWAAGAALNNNQLSGFLYDIAGNMLASGPAQQYWYDVENRISTTAGGSTYTYDGDGQRVEKSGTNALLYWTGGGGEVLSESNLSGTFTADYIFFNGQRIARSDAAVGVRYYFSDHLGSTSIITDGNGNVQEESYYYPYGGEMPVITGDTNHYKFTGKERDTETNNDYFGARYHGSSMGRFLTPDWAAKPTTVPYAMFGDPQSLNLYGYVRNNPLSRTDPDGHLDCGGNNGQGVGCQFIAWFNQVHEIVQNQTTATVNPTAYKTRDAAAMAAEKQAIKLTNDKNGTPPKTDWEFGGWIVKKGTSYYYTEPLQGTERGEIDVDSIRVPKGFTKAAGYHTHPDGGDWGEGFSGYPWGDVGWSEKHAGGPMAGYVGMTYSGNVRVYVPSVTNYDPYGVTGDLVGNVYK